MSLNPPDSSIRVLIAEDHQLFRDGLVSLLEREADLQVVGQAADGAQAVALAQEIEPDVVLMDIMMPEFSGLEATRRLMAWRPELKIIILTISDRDEDLFDAIKAGASGYLLKGSTGAAELVDTLRRVRAGEAIITPTLVPQVLAEFSAMARGRGEARPPAEPPPAAPPSGIAQLTDREREVLDLVAEGLTNRQIAERLVVSENTVRAHLRNILDKLHVNNRVQAALLLQKQDKAS
jgi:two-component system NarL family response regulator